MKELRGRTAIVTGGASGIGRGTALALAGRGVNVVVADLDIEGMDETVRTIAAQGGTSICLPCDVGTDTALEDLRDRALDRFGAVHIIMNNVGGITRGLPEHLPIAEWRRIINVNLLSVVRSNLAFLPMLIEQREGHIVNTASFAGLFTYSFDRQPYAATKAAIVQISEGLSLYLRPHGVGVTCLCPGPVKTGIMRSLRSFGPATDTRGPGPEFSLRDPAEVGEMVVEAILKDRFMVPTDDKVLALLIDRASDWDAFLDRQALSPQIVAKAAG